MIEQTLMWWLALTPVGAEDLAGELAELDSECLRLREEGEGGLATVYLRLAALHEGLEQWEQACQAYARCALQTTDLEHDLVLAERCLSQYDLCSDNSWQWLRHRADYHIARGALAWEQGDLHAAFMAYRAAEISDDAPPGRQAHAAARQFVILSRLSRLDQMTEVERRFIALHATFWRFQRPLRAAQRPRSASCVAPTPDELVEQRYFVNAVEDIAAECIHRQLLGHGACTHDLVDTLTRVRAARLQDPGSNFELVNTEVNLAWAYFLRDEPRAAARLVRALRSPKREDLLRQEIHGLRSKLMALRVLNGDWRDEATATVAAAETGGDAEARWLAHVWRAEAALVLGEADAALADLYAAEDILDEVSLSLEFGASRQGYFAYHDLSLRHLVDLLQQRGNPATLLALARRAVRRPGQLLSGSANNDVPLNEHSPVQSGALELAVVRGTREWFAVAVDRYEAAIVPLGYSADTDPSTFRDDPALLHPIDRWLVRNDVVHPWLPGPARAVPFAALWWNGAPLALRRLVVHVVESPATPAVNPQHDSALVSIYIDENQLSQLAEEQVRSELYHLQDNGWLVNSFSGPYEVSPDEILGSMPDVRLFVLYARGLRSSANRWTMADSWDSTIALGEGDAMTVEDILAAVRVPELVILIACDSAGPDGSSGAIDGVAPLFALRGSHWVVSVTGQLNERVAHQFLSILLPKLAADDDLNVGAAVQSSRETLLTNCSRFACKVLSAELAKIVVFEGRHSR